MWLCCVLHAVTWGWNIISLLSKYVVIDAHIHHYVSCMVSILDFGRSFYVIRTDSCSDVYILLAWLHARVGISEFQAHGLLYVKRLV
jgi:hypothetical protein